MAHDVQSFAVAMLFTRRRIDVPSLGVKLTTDWALHSRFRAVYRTLTGVGWDDAVVHPRMPVLGHDDRAFAHVVLRGRCVARAYGRTVTLEAGDLCLMGHATASRLRSERDFECLEFEWDAGSVGASLPGSMNVVRLAPRAMDCARATAAAFAGARGPDEASRALATWIDALRAAGVPLDRTEAGALCEPVAPSIARLAPILEWAVANPTLQPTLVDLTGRLGLCERQVHRLVERFQRTYGFNAAGWRDTAWRARIVYTLLCMNAPGATTEGTAALAGFRSPSALCHTFARLGLPAPGRIPQAFAACA